MYILIGMALLISILTYINWFTTANALQLAKVARTGFVILTILTLSFLALSGKLAGFLIGLLALLPAIGNVRQIWIKNFQDDNLKLRSPSAPEQTENTLNNTNHEPDFTRGYALEILGLDESATDKQITEKYRRIIRHIHPDKDGSSLLTSQVNRAKYVLLGE